MIDANAANYLSRSTSWCNEVKNPVMTSNTAPSGECFGDSKYDSNTDYYYAFNNISSNSWGSSSGAFPHYIGYRFTEAQIITSVDITYQYSGGGGYVKNFTIQGSNDLTTWNDIYSDIAPNNTTADTTVSYSFNNDTRYLAYRIYITSNYRSNTQTCIKKFLLHNSSITGSSIAMNYIGQNDYTSYILMNNSLWLNALLNSDYTTSVITTSTPTMTSATAPSGTVSRSNAEDSAHEAWHAFDKTSTGWGTTTGYTTNQWIQYKFPTAQTIYGFKYQANGAGSNRKIRNGFIYVSNDDNPSTIAKTITENTNWMINAALDSPVTATTFRMYFTNVTSGADCISVVELDFYGREFGDIQSLLHAADIYDKDYTTIEEVLADSTTLSDIISSANAIDYLTATTKYITAICNNASAMTAIGNNNYASNTLLDNSNWRAAICSSAYFESVLNVKVPIMTSNTTPSGEAFASSEDRASIGDWHVNSYAYNAFDKNNSVQWVPSDWSTNEGWVAYDFTDYVKIYKWYVYTEGDTKTAGGTAYRVKDYRLEGSNDKVTWTSYMTSIYDGLSGGENKIISTDSYSAYRYHRLHVLTNYAGNFPTTVFELQLYGRKDV